MQIIPSLLVKTKSEFLTQLQGLKDSCKLVQLDIADGKFVANKTWADPKIVGEQKQNFELHLMVTNPEKELKRWQNIKNIKRIYTHFESTTNWEKIIELTKNNHWQLGVVLNPDTKPQVLKKYLNQIKAVMFMTVYPGRQGQKLIPKVLPKISKFKKNNPHIFVAIDGAVSEETLSLISKTQADIICPGSAIFHNERTPKENVKRFKKIINNLKK